MGQKINPFSLRLGVVKTWPSRWFVKGGKQSYAAFLQEDEAIRKVIREKINQAGIAAVEIERTNSSLKVYIRAARPGLIIGQGGKGIEDLAKAIERALRKLRGQKSKLPNVSLSVEELKRSDTSSTYVAQQIAWDIERRMHFRRVMKKQIDQVMQSKDVKGIKVTCKGRLGGAEIARTETLKKGALPLQTLRADIDYGTATAYTTYGTIGIKVWVYKGEVFARREVPAAKPEGRVNQNSNR